MKRRESAGRVAARREFLTWGAIAVVIGVAIAGGGCGSAGSGPLERTRFLEPGEVAPDLELMRPDGTTTSLREVQAGRVALVDVWATWCQPCLAAAPHLDAWHKQYADRGFTVIGIMTDTNAEKRASFFDEHPVSYPQFVDNDGDDLKRAWGPFYSIPLMVLLDRDGTVIEVFTGTTDLAALGAKLREILDGQPPDGGDAPA